jgi:hypothetical protein
LVRVWRCAEPACALGTFTERHDPIAPRARLTTRAVRWATDALAYDDTTVSALARHLGVNWHTLWDAVEVEATHRTADPARLSGIRVLGVDEHIWRPSRVGDAQRAVTGMVDRTRDTKGRLHARLLDVVPGRTGTAYAGWLTEQSAGFIDGVEQASLDPFRGYANAIRDELPDAVAVLDAFHVVKLGTGVVDEAAGACSRRPWDDEDTREIRCTRSVGCCAEAESTCQTSRSPRSTPASGSATRPSSDRGLARLPAAALDVPGQGPGPRQGRRRTGHRLVPDLPDP